MVVLLSLRVLAPHLYRLCLLDRRLLHRLLSWARHPATFAFSTGACCTASCQARHPATCAFSTGACCTGSFRARHSAPCVGSSSACCSVSSQARHSAACVSPAEACCAVSLFVVGAQAYSHGVNGHRGAARSWAHGEVAPGGACVATPPLVPPRPTPAIPPPLLGTTPRHLCLLDRRLLRRLLSGTTPRYFCLLDRRLLQARRAQGCRRRQNLTGACCTVSCQTRHPATCAFSTGACCKCEERKDAVAVETCRGREVRFGPSRRVRDEQGAREE
jgi:hypothetical protein